MVAYGYERIVVGKDDGTRDHNDDDDDDGKEDDDDKDDDGDEEDDSDYDDLRPDLGQRLRPRTKAGDPTVLS